jgi:hypothetical protein
MTATSDPAEIPDPRTHPTLNVAEAAPLIGCSSWAVYEAIKRGDFPVEVLRVGRKIRVPTRPLLDRLGLLP